MPGAFSTSTALVFGVAFVILEVLIGAMQAATPWLMPRQECFAVTVPPSAQADPRLVGLKRSFSLVVGLLTLGGVVATVGALALGGESVALVVCCAVMCGVLVVVPFVLMLVFRARVMRIKRAEGWRPGTELRAAVVAERDLPRPVSLAWHLLDLVPIALTAILLALLWDEVPSQVPTHVGLSGVVDAYTPKGPAIVAFPLLMQVFLGACLTASHWMIGHSRRPVDPRRPAGSALSYALFARAMGICLVVTDVAVCALFVAFPLASAGVISLGQAGAVALVGILPPVVGILIVAASYGQAGARVLRGADRAARDARGPQGAGDEAAAAGSGAGTGADADTDMAADEDACWKLGILYVNRDDPSLFVPARFGVGWTINYGRPGAWAFIAGILLVCAGIVAVSLLL